MVLAFAPAPVEEWLLCLSGRVRSPFFSVFTGTRSPGAAGLTGRDSSVPDDTGSQAGDGEEAFDFFEQQDGVAAAGQPVLGQRSEARETSLEEEEEEEEELDPLGILR